MPHDSADTLTDFRLHIASGLELWLSVGADQVRAVGAEDLERLAKARKKIATPKFTHPPKSLVIAL